MKNEKELSQNIEIKKFITLIENKIKEFFKDEHKVIVSLTGDNKEYGIKTIIHDKLVSLKLSIDIFKNDITMMDYYEIYYGMGSGGASCGNRYYIETLDDWINLKNNNNALESFLENALNNKFNFKEIEKSLTDIVKHPYSPSIIMNLDEKYWRITKKNYCLQSLDFSNYDNNKHIFDELNSLLRKTQEQ